MTQDTMRRLADANPAREPETFTDAEWLFAQIVAAPGDARLSTTPSTRRTRRGVTKATQASLVAAAGVTAAVIIAVSQAGSPASPQARVMYRLAADSASTPAFSGRYIVRVESDTYSSLPGQTEQITEVDDTRSGANTVFDTDLDLKGVSPAVRKQLGVTGVDALIDPIPFLYPESWYASLSTDPTALTDQLIPLGEFVVSSQLGTQVSNAVVKQALAHGSVTPATEPADTTERADDIFVAATDLLASPEVGPQLRSALYTVLATTSGVTVNPHATDPAGRPAISMSRSYSQDGQQLQSITYEDPNTGAMLARTSSQYGAGAPITGSSTAIYQPATATDTMPTDPYPN